MQEVRLYWVSAFDLSRGFCMALAWSSLTVAARRAAQPLDAAIFAGPQRSSMRRTEPVSRHWMWPKPKCRRLCVTPHVAAKVKHSAIDQRTSMSLRYRQIAKIC